MKTTQTSSIPATLPLAADTEASVQNLRQPSPGTPLRPVCPPQRLCTATGTPLLSWTTPDGSVIHLLQSSSLALLALDGDGGGDPLAIATLPAAAAAAISTPVGIYIFTPEGNYHLDPDALAKAMALGSAPADGSLLVRTDVRYPAVAIAPTALRTHSAYTSAFTLADGFPDWSGAIGSYDLEAFRKATVGALRTATKAAVADGCAASPLLAWYRLRDAAGSIIFSSTPVVVTPDGIQGPEAIEVEVTKANGSYGMVGVAPVAVTAFKVGLSVDPAQLTDDHRRATSLELLMAPPIDLVDYEAYPHLTRLAHDANAGIMRVELPRLAQHAAVVPALLDRLATVSKVVATVFDPFNPDGPLASATPYVPDISLDLAPEAAQKGLLAAIARPSQSSAAATLMREVSLPHAFTANVAANVGDICALADVTPVHALPTPLSAMWLTGTDSGAWSAKVRVTLLAADGQPEQLCTETAGSGPLPTALLPLLAYPHPGAKTMEVELTTPSGTVARTFTLLPTPAQAAACYCPPSLAPIPIGDFAAAEPFRAVTVRHPVRHPSALLIADSAAPLAPVATAQVGAAAVVAVTETPRSTSGLAFGRSHLYAFSNAGIYAVSVSAARAVAVSLLNRAAVADAAAVAVGPDAVYAATAAGVLALTGARTSRLHPGRFAALGYSPKWQELWCLPPGGAAAKAHPTVLDPQGRVYARTDMLPTAFSRNAATLLVATADGVYDASTEEEDPDALVAIAWRRRLKVAANWVPRVRSLLAVMAAESADIAIDLLGDNGGQPHRFGGLMLAGDIAIPPFVALIAHPHRYVTISLSGRVSPDASLTSFQLDFHKSPF